MSSSVVARHKLAAAPANLRNHDMDRHIVGEAHTGAGLNRLARARLKKFTWRDYNTDAAPVELRPLAAVFTAWRSTRTTTR
ncbi:MAG: hypothetical protein WBR15_01500 [Gammaproteobacteria bacterium]